MTHPLEQRQDMIDTRNGKAPTAQNSVTVAMAERYGMDARAFEATVRATCGAEKASREEFAAFLLVAKEYKLNPVTREIYAFPRRGGGIVPIVSIDGWISLVNSHPQFDGMEFRDRKEKGKLVGITCKLYRKDRGRPYEIEELLEECRRETEPWKQMPHRMLRHKALIQCARYAFGFSGIYDEEEGAVIAEARDITPEPPVPPVPPPNGSGPTKDAVQGSSPRAADEQGGSSPPAPAASSIPPGEHPLDVPKPLRRGKIEEAEIVDEEPAGMTPEELAEYLDKQGIKAPSETPI